MIQASAIVLLFLITLGTSVVAAEPTNRELATAYVRSLPSDTKIYVWPTKLRVFEIVGRVDPVDAAATVADYATTHPETILLSFPGPPRISIFAYDDETADPWQEFVAVSRTLNTFKQSLNTHFLEAQACAFTGLVSRDIWAAGGVVFLDRSRLSADEQRECVRAGLDYINGFPTPPRFDYKEFPSGEVRQVVLGAVMKCSEDGPLVGEPTEQTKDGLTPPPQAGLRAEEYR